MISQPSRRPTRPWQVQCARISHIEFARDYWAYDLATATLQSRGCCAYELSLITRLGLKRKPRNNIMTVQTPPPALCYDQPCYPELSNRLVCARRSG